MKNIFRSLALTVAASFSIINTADCQPVINATYSPEAYGDTPISSCNGGVCDAYRYVSFGVGPVLFIPNIGIGYRERFSQFGWDTALSLSTIGYAHQLGAHLVGHYYLSPSRQNSAYLGVGLMGGGVFTNHDGGCAVLSPDFVLGKELERNKDSRHFIEMHLGLPSMWMTKKHHHSTSFPMMYIKYGISF